MSLRVAVIMPCWNEAVLLPYFFRNYAWAERILVFDNGSADDSRAIVKRYPKAEVRDFDTKGVHDDVFLTEIKNTAWKEFRGKGYDYVCVVDGDEFLWASDIVDLLRRYKMAGITLIQPTGYDMVSQEVPTSDGPIESEIFMGVESPGYSKPCIFAPDAIEEIAYSHGAHSAEPTGIVNKIASRGLLLLHYRFLGLEYVLKRNGDTAPRVSARNRENNWGFQFRPPDDEHVRVYEALRHRAARIIPPQGTASSTETISAEAAAPDWNVQTQKPSGPLEFVIARFEEDTSWTEELPGRVVVYDKGSKSGGYAKLPNVGRESHTYLTHIARHYRSLQGIVVFCQGDARDHAPHLLARLNSASKPFDYLGEQPLACAWDGSPHHHGLPIHQFWDELMPDLPKPPELNFVPGAIFYARAETVRRRPIEFYEKALALHGSFELAPWILERLWFYIFESPQV